VTPRVTRVELQDGGLGTLVALPFAGGTQHAYHALAVELPGWRVVSGAATGEPAGLAALADAWWDAVGDDLTPGAVLYGHSLGACVGAGLLVRHAPGGVAAVLSGFPVDPRHTLPAGASDDELLAWARRHGATPEVSDEALARFVLPRLRRDLAHVDGRWRDWLAAVDATLVTGDGDPLCPPRALRAASRADVPLHVVPGGDHTLPTSRPGRVAALVRAARTIPTPAAATAPASSREDAP